MRTPARPPLTRHDVVRHTREPWPLPGAGSTARRWAALSAISTRDLPLAKLVEPHHDAAAILHDLDVAAPEPDEVWAVWAAEPPSAVLRGVEGPAGWRLTGTKAFCSGAGLATHALVTAETDAGSRLFAIELASAGIEVDAAGPAWAGTGMSRSETVSLALTDVPARAVGAAGAYVDRPGFWLGAVGVAACWLGGAHGVAATTEQSSGRLDAHGRAHLGAIRSALDTADLAFEAAAALVDRESLSIARAERLALALRAQVADVVQTVVGRTGRALGPGPLAFDGFHAEHVADLLVFVRQDHAERDLERLGRIGAGDA